MSTKEKTSYPKEKIRILFLENISDLAVKNFQQQGYVQVEKITKALTEEELIKEIKDVHILGIRSKTQITSKVLDAAKKTAGNWLFLYRSEPGQFKSSYEKRCSGLQCTLFQHKICCRTGDRAIHYADPQNT